MIQQESRLQVADNSGASVVSCIRILDNSMQKTASVGDRIVVAVKKIDKVGGVKCGDVSKAVIVRTRKEIRREDGSYVRFGDNAVVLLNDNNEIRGSRIFGPIAKEVVEKGFDKIGSLAVEVL